MPIKYDLKSIGLYTGVAMVLYGANYLVETPYTVVNIAIKTVLFSIFLVLMVKRDFPLRVIPIVNRFFK